MIENATETSRRTPLKVRSKFTVSVRHKAIVSTEARGTPEVRIEAATIARPSVKDGPHDGKILSIIGPGLWGDIVLSGREVDRLVRDLTKKPASKNPDPDVQTVFFPRKVPYGAKS